MDSLEDLLGILDKVQGLSGAALICFSCIIVGYLLRFIRSFPNDGIPLVVILWGALFNLLLADPYVAGSSLRVWTVKNFLVGLIYGAIAWGVHYWALSKIEDYISKKFPAVGDTAFFTKPVTNQPQINPTKPNENAPS